MAAYSLSLLTHWVASSSTIFFPCTNQVGVATLYRKVGLDAQIYISCIEVSDMPMEDEGRHQLMMELQEAKARYVKCRLH